MIYYICSTDNDGNVSVILEYIEILNNTERE